MTDAVNVMLHCLTSRTRVCVRKGTEFVRQVLSGLILECIGIDRINGQTVCFEQLLQGQQRILEMVAGGESLRQSLQAIAAFSEECLPEMLASILYYDPYEERLRDRKSTRLNSSHRT